MSGLHPAEHGVLTARETKVLATIAGACSGALCGIFALSSLVLRQRRDLAALKKKNFQETPSAPAA